jgi:hypothetical protein
MTATLDRVLLRLRVPLAQRDSHRGWHHRVAIVVDHHDAIVGDVRTIERPGGREQQSAGTVVAYALRAAMKNKVENEDAGETPSALPKGVVESVRAKTLARLETFKLDVAEASIETRGGVWSYRRTAGTGPLPTLLLPGIQGGGDVFYELALRIGDAAPLVAASAPGIEDVGAMVDSTLQFLFELQLDPEQASRHAHFESFAIGVEDRTALEAWDAILTENAVPHSPVLIAVRGWAVVIEDPDGDRMRLQSREDHDAGLRPDEESPWVLSVRIG